MKWISVDKELPEIVDFRKTFDGKKLDCFSDIVLAYSEEGEYYHYLAYLTDNGIWSTIPDETPAPKLTHWMPLPKDPEK